MVSAHQHQDMILLSYRGLARGAYSISTGGPVCEFSFEKFFPKMGIRLYQKRYFSQDFIVFIRAGNVLC